MKGKIGVFAAILAVAALGIALPAGAWNMGPWTNGGHHSGTFRYHSAHLKSVPHAPAASGSSHATADSQLLKVGPYVIAIEKVTGAAPGLPHAQHIHGPGAHVCPSIARDTNHDGLIDTTEGTPDYGPIVVSLTTTGDTSPASALAVSRFPVANSHGDYTYTRVLRIGTDIPVSVANHIEDFHIVTHGIDTNHNGAYDFSKGPSDLTPSLPQEATVPASCGLIH